MSFNIRSFQDIYDTSAESMYNFDEFEKYLIGYCPLLFSDSLSKQDIDKKLKDKLEKEKLECVRLHQLTVWLPALENEYLDYNKYHEVTGLRSPYAKYLHKLGWDAIYDDAGMDKHTKIISIILKPLDTVDTYE